MLNISQFHRWPQDMLVVGDYVFEIETLRWATENNPDRELWYVNVILLNRYGSQTNTQTRVDFNTYPESPSQRKRIAAAAVAMAKELDWNAGAKHASRRAKQIG